MAEPIPLPTPAQTVTLAALLIPLMRLCLLVVSMGICACADALCRAFFGTVNGAIGWIPFLGSVTERPIHAIEDKVTSFLGGLESHIDVSMGGYIHALADAVGRLASGEAETGWVLYLYGKALGALRHAVNVLPSTGSVHTITRTVVKQTRVIVRDVHTVGKIAFHGIGEDVLPRIRSVEREVNGEIVRERIRARGIERTLDREITNLWKWARTHSSRVGAVAFAGAVALALSRLGLGWLRCSSLSRLGKRVGCSGFGALEELLFGAVTALAVTDICDFAALAYAAAEDLSPLLLELVDVENALVGCHGATAPPPLSIAVLSLPVVTNPLPLAA